MDSPEVVDAVISAFKDRNLLIKRDAIESALTEAAHVEWVSKHLRPDTLLSREELNLHVSQHWIDMKGSAANMIYQIHQVRKLRCPSIRDPSP